ncbi:hypothetical protein ACAW74_00055 [Fibrella sp. WM1]|uniref:hypothetical protein n=1 Tax=Fibrella musci TaxID=3242485 RepID=UPI00351FB250
MKLNKMSYPVILAFFGALLSAGAALWASLEQAEESRINSELNKQIARKSEENAKKSDIIARIAQESKAEQARFSTELNAKQEQLIAKQEQLLRLEEIQNNKSEEIARLNADLAHKSDEVARLSSKAVNYVTGGDNFCYVSLDMYIPAGIGFRLMHSSVGDYKNGDEYASVQHNDSYILSNVGMLACVCPKNYKISLDSFKSFKEFYGEYVDGSKLVHSRYSYGQVSPYERRDIDISVEGVDLNEVDLLFRFDALNGRWIQHLKIEPKRVERAGMTVTEYNIYTNVYKLNNGHIDTLYYNKALFVR